MICPTKCAWAPASCTDLLRRLAVAAFVAATATFAAPPTAADAKVYYARDEALALALPGAERIEARDFVLTPEQHQRIEKTGRAPLASDLVTVYVGWRGGEPFAYAIFDTHTVRTFPETFVVVVTSEGRVGGVHILAFHEPEDYLPSRRWLDTLSGRGLDAEMEVGRDVAAVTGSTLSTRAVTSAVRRVLATWAVLVGGK